MPETDPEPDVDVVLKPLSRPDLGDIRVNGVFAIGRTEQPFASYPADVLVMLSRRQARIFSENGQVYVADLESRNGTTVNRHGVGQTPCRLNDGDEVCFGGVLSYRVQIAARATAARPDGLVLTLTPQSGASGLEPIIVPRLPFLIGKADPAFARYQREQPRQVSFLSRRHAHIFRKDGRVHIEDLESTNGTFVDGIRLQEHAVPLEDGMLVAFGGEHFTYRVGIQQGSEIEQAAAGAGSPPGMASAQIGANERNAAGDKTTFVAAPTSFLEIFCADDEQEQKPAQDTGASSPPAVAMASPAQAQPKRRPRSRSVVLMSELAAVFIGHEGGFVRGWWKLAAVGAVLASLALGLYWSGHAERALKDALERGDYARASVLANQRLLQRPDDIDARTVATDATLKAHVPEWLTKLRARDFDGAQAVLAHLAELGKRNSDLRPLVAELEWLGNLQRLVAARGGSDARVRIYLDEDRIAALIAHWNDNTGEHQRALARIASYVPQFGDLYAEALTQLRKLQSDASVYLAAIDRLKTAITLELGRDEPQALVPLVKEAADKYPGLGGLDGVRRDLAQYIELQAEARNPKSERLFALLLKARFTTPPFEEAFRTLSASRQLPSASMLQQYAVATAAWKDGNTADGIAGLQKIVAGPWADSIRREVQRRQSLLAQFAALQSSHASTGYTDQLFAFRASLDPDQDVHFVRATQADVDAQRDRALQRAQELMNRARSAWQDYRNAGAIEARQRAETTISTTFRNRARLLSDADSQARQAIELHRLVNATAPGPFVLTRDEIRAEVEQQRAGLEELRNVLDPELLNNKLALLGGER